MASYDSRPPTIAIVVGEHSGDTLGAGLMHSLRLHHPQARFIGIGGPKMIAQGFESWFDMQALSVMGLVEVLRHLPKLLSIRKHLVRRLLNEKPDVFIGIDAPDFNLGVERRLHAQGVKTVHYVSPSVWAWRKKRVDFIRKHVDLVLTLFPFETAVYEQKGVPVCCVGHPLGQTLKPEPACDDDMNSFGLKPGQAVLTLLPGSRVGEVSRLIGPYLDAVVRLRESGINCQAIAALADERTRVVVEEALRQHSVAQDVHVVVGKTTQAMRVGHVMLLASGTISLEAMLLEKPMVVTYKLAPLTYRILKKMVKLNYYSLPNLLAGEALVPELIQDDANPMAIADAVKALWNNDELRRQQQERFTQLSEPLRGDANARAASAIVELI